MPKLTLEEVEEIGRRYTAGELAGTLTSEFGLRASGLSQLFRRISVKMRPGGRVPIYRCNHNFFSVIDDEITAYWLGFFVADGCVYKNRDGKKFISIALCERDTDHLELFRTHTECTHPVVDQTSGYGTKTKRVRFRSSAMFDDLGRLGVGERKSLTAVPPVVPDALSRHFWRGVIDGDGSVFAGLTSYHERSVHICGSEATCRAFAAAVSHLANVSVRPSGKIFVGRAGGGKQAGRIAQWLYDGATVALTRKASSAVKLIALLTPKIAGACSTVDCDNPQRAKGYCHKCRERQLRPVRARRKSPPIKKPATCIVDGCISQNYCKGLCTSCYGKQMRRSAILVCPKRMA